MNYRPDQTVAVRALRNAAPYIRMFKGKVFVDQGERRRLR